MSLHMLIPSPLLPLSVCLPSSSSSSYSLLPLLLYTQLLWSSRLHCHGDEECPRCSLGGHLPSYRLLCLSSPWVQTSQTHGTHLREREERGQKSEKMIKGRVQEEREGTDRPEIIFFPLLLRFLRASTHWISLNMSPCGLPLIN